MACEGDALLSPPLDGAAERLSGGTANFGRVVRVGNMVRRPSGAHTPAVHALLRHLRRRGFDGAPRPIGVRGSTEVLEYVEGVAATEPLETWALSDEVLAGVGKLLAVFHQESAGFDGRGLRWQRPVPAPWRGELITHNDLNPANIVFRHGRAAAVIDFDLAAPGSAAFDLAVAACFWAPLRAPNDVPDSRRGRASQRLTALLDGYEAGPRLRADVAEACPAANGWIASIIQDASQHGHPAFGRVWTAQAATFARADGWLRANRTALLATSHPQVGRHV